MIDRTDTRESGSVRLFFGMLPDAAIRDRLSAAARDLPLPAAARPVPPDNYHATLAFIGDVPGAQLPLVQEIGRDRRAARFSLVFDAYDYWPKPEVVVAAARTIPSVLEQLWRELHGALALRQWALDPKRLRPHVTLARKVSQAPVLQDFSIVEWAATEFSLLRSETRGSEPVYTVVDTWPLLYEPAKT